MQLNRKQELTLANYGLQKLLEDLIPAKPTRSRRKKKVAKKNSWSPERRKKFAATMARKWTKKRKGHGKTS